MPEVANFFSISVSFGIVLLGSRFCFGNALQDRFHFFVSFRAFSLADFYAFNLIAGCFVILFDKFNDCPFSIGWSGVKMPPCGIVVFHFAPVV
jgi:hypothetical protein